MNDKTLKIRIKLHSAGTSPESPSADTDDSEGRISASPISQNRKQKRLPWIAGSLGLIALLITGIYVFNGQESDNPVITASNTNHGVGQSLQISTEPSPGSTPQRPNRSDDPTVQELTGVEERPPPISLDEAANLEFESQSKPAESDSHEFPAEKPSLQAGTGSPPSTAVNEDITPSTSHSKYAALGSSVREYDKPATRNQNEAERSLSEGEKATAIRTDDQASTLNTESLSNDNESGTVVLSETHSESPLIASPTSRLTQVVRAQLTSGIEAREPIDRVERTFHSDGQKLKRLYYFTELQGMKGNSIIHRWNYKGRTVANITFDISGNRWRVYSSKNLSSSMKGPWNVVVTDSSGKPLISESFVYD